MSSLDTIADILGKEHTEAMATYRDKLLDVIRFALESHDSISRQDIVTTLRYKAEMHETNGRPILRRGADSNENAAYSTQSLPTNDYEDSDHTYDRLFNICLSARTSTIYRQPITDNQITTVLNQVAAYVEQQGLDSILTGQTDETLSNSASNLDADEDGSTVEATAP